MTGGATGCGCGCGCGGSATLAGSACGRDQADLCGCCEGLAVVTPVEAHNRPGLDAIEYRVGTHGRFLASMLARLSSAGLPALKGLRTRDRDDFAVALLDGWATVGDVLTFYQERIANEGYLRTATERRSVLELARLIGYAPRPGLAATAYLAYTVEPGLELTIPVGSRVQSVPGPGELPQTFETADPVVARGEYSRLAVRRTRPQHIVAPVAAGVDGLVVVGAAGDLKRGDIVRVSNGSGGALLSITDVSVDAVGGTTTLGLTPLAGGAQSALAVSTRARALEDIAERFGTPAEFGVSARQAQRALPVVRSLGDDELDSDELIADLRDHYSRASARGSDALAAWLQQVLEAVDAIPAETAEESEGNGEANGDGDGDGDDGLSPLGRLIGALRKPASIPPPSARELHRDAATLYSTTSGFLGQLVGVVLPEVKTTLSAALANTTASSESDPTTYERFRVKASLFGHNAPPLDDEIEEESDDEFGPTTTLELDAVYDTIQPGGTIILINRDLDDEEPEAVRTVVAVATVSAAKPRLAARVTQVTIDVSWPSEETQDLDTVIRRTQVLADGDRLTLADEPIDAEEVEGDMIELADLHPDLTPGRWVIVAGERTDGEIRDVQGIESTGGTGVHGAELAMIAAVEQRAALLDDNSELPGDSAHTFIRLAEPLAYHYRRSTVVVHGNVVRATHGESKSEILGSGDASKPFQRFALKQPPLTYLPAPTALGAAPTLELRVNDVLWHEAESLIGVGPTERRYVIRTDDDGKTAVVAGEGVRGARLPTGTENVRATYRSGIGKGGNVDTGRLTVVVSKPLGVKEVLNPLSATGGADRETRDQARRNAPVTVQALDRLVSVQDYEDFARVFAGIGTASARELSDGRRQIVHVTIAGVDDAPIAPTSDLHRNLRRALVELGDPFQPLELSVRVLRLLVIEASVRIDPDHQWEVVEPALRAALLARFGTRDLGQSVGQADVLRTMQAVPGVVYVDLQILDSLGEAELSRPDPSANLTLRARVPAALTRFDDAGEGAGTVLPAQLLILSPLVPDTLILSELR